MDYSIEHFGDEKSKMFFFTDSKTTLIARKMEVNDNVIPSSNSVMARNLFYLSKYFHDHAFQERAKFMLANVYDGMEMYGSGYSNWGMLLNHQIFSLHEIVCMDDTQSSVETIQSAELPKILLAKRNSKSALPIFNDKRDADTKSMFVCVEGACLLPTTDVTEAINQVIQ
ncbi:MAG: hypothetical protein ACJAXI_003387 [Crocinitomicaceae bacterium]|jgi:uncharacterized protein YyaL (SSP411 family)